MTERDPTRLTAQSDTGDRLRSALESLGQEGADSERLARVAGKLGALLDAPPPPLSLSARVLRLLGKKTTLAKLAALPLLLGGALWLARGTEPGAEPSPQPQVAPTPAPPTPAQVPEVPVETPSVEPLQTAAPEPATVAEVPRRATVRRVTHPGTATLAPAAPEHTELEPSAAETSARPTTTTAPAAAERPAERARPRSEAELLFEARKALPAQPAAALRLLDQHAQLHPRGLLAPEREVLAIQALRLLGDVQAAEQRTRRFRSEHPDSFHLQQLE